jgi:ubiquinone/menaquinone biosynthesis C-methylase UbiE
MSDAEIAFTKLAEKRAAMQTADSNHAQTNPARSEAPPSPAHIFETLAFGHARVEALKAGIELELFTRIAEGLHTAEQLGARCGASERGVRTLCDFLVINGFLTKSSAGYDVTADTGLFLDNRSPAYFGSVAKFLASRQNVERFAAMIDCVRAGHAVSDISNEAYEWMTFAQAMIPLMAPVAAATAEVVNVKNAGPIRVLDIAAGHGEFGLALARKNRDAQIVAIDFSEVIAIAIKRANEAGCGNRYTTLEGNAFDLDLGGPYDIVLLPNFLHHFPPEKVERFLVKVASVVKEDGLLVTVEFIPNDDRVSPPAAGMFSMMMLVVADGDAYTFAELDNMLRRAGFSKNRAYPALPTPQTIIVSERA